VESSHFKTAIRLFLSLDQKRNNNGKKSEIPINNSKRACILWFMEV